MVVSFRVSSFRSAGVRYEPSEKTKSEIYVDLLPMLNGGSITLPRSDKLVRQLCSLERTVARGTNRESIDHPRDRGMHDDIANAVAGAAWLASVRGGYNLWGPAFSERDEEEPPHQPPPRKHPNLSDADYERITRPVCMTPREFMPEGVEAAFARARLDALRRRGLP